MGICEKCRDMSPENVLRQSGDVLCVNCERIRVDTLAKEREEREQRSHSDPSPTSPCDQNDSLTTASNQKPAASLSTKKNSKSQVTCIPGCKQKNKKASPSIRCCLCAQWFHEKCVKLNEYDTVGVWPCPNCRDMAQDIKRADTNISALTTAVSELSNALAASKLQQEKILSELSGIRELNKSLIEQNNKLLKEFQSLKEDNSPQNSPSIPTHSLLIGSSLIRNFDEAKLNDYKICCMPGAVMADIHHKLDMYVKDGFQFKSVIIVAGGNDASLPSDKFKSDVSAAALTAAIRAAKSLAPDVTVSAIPPRAQPSHAMENIDILNGIFKSMSEEMSVPFATNDEHFFLRNGSINEGYLYDSVHLTLKGANKLAESLGLMNIVNGQNTGVCSFKPSQPRCYDHKPGSSDDMESEQTDLTHSFWSVARSKASKARPANRMRTAGPTPAQDPHPSRPNGHRVSHMAQPQQANALSHRTHSAQPRGNSHSYQGLVERSQQASGRRSPQGHSQSYFDDLTQSHRPPRHRVMTNRRPLHPHVPSVPSQGPGQSYGLTPNPQPHFRETTQRRPLHPHPPSSPPRHASGAYNQRAPQHGVNQLRNSSGRQVTYPQKTQPNRVSHSMNRGLSVGHRSYVNALNSNNECCVFCGEINHRSWSCKHGLPIKCFTCGADGHKSRFCPCYNE